MPQNGPCSMSEPPLQLHENPFRRLSTILLTAKQTDKQTNKTTEMKPQHLLFCGSNEAKLHHESDWRTDPIGIPNNTKQYSSWHLYKPYNIVLSKIITYLLREFLSIIC